MARVGNVLECEDILPIPPPLKPNVGCKEIGNISMSDDEKKTSYFPLELSMTF